MANAAILAWRVLLVLMAILLLVALGRLILGCDNLSMVRMLLHD